MKKLRVIISGLIFPLTMLHYFWRAFERRNDIDLFVLGPFFGDWIPWNYGMKLPQKYVKYPDLCLPQQSARMPVDPILAEVQLPEHMRNPDLWLQIDANWHFAKRPTAKVVAHIQTDPHVLKEYYQFPKSYSDVNFCMQQYYMEDGEHYLPYGYDPELHYSDPNAEKIYDACLIGLHYDNRTAWVDELKKRKHSVYYSIGEIYSDYREKYNQSKIALSWSTLQDTPARFWEALGMGNILVANRTPDVNNWFVDGEHFLGFSNLSEAVDKVEWALSNPDKAQEIADAGHRKVYPHTWDARVRQVLEVCKLR